MRDAGREQVTALTGLRFFAALHVVLLHYVWAGMSAAERAGLSPWLAGALSSGYLGVSLFFVLSGFILTYSYVDRTGRMRADTVQFWWARVARVYPVYLLALIVALPALGRWAQLTLRTESAWPATARIAAVAGLNATLLQAWVPGSAHPWNEPGWSLAVEMFFYALFPFIAPAVVRQAGARRAVVGLALWLAALAIPTAYCLLWPDPYLSPTGTRPQDMTVTVLNYFPLFHLPQMLIGVAAGSAFVARRDAQPGDRRRWGAVADLAAAAYLLGLGLTPSLPYPLLHDGLLAPLYALMIFGLASGDGLVSRLLSRPAVVLLGEASYALYLLHQPIGARIDRFFRTAGLADSTSVAHGVAAVVSLAASLLVLRAFEEPARQAIRRWSDRHFVARSAGRSGALPDARTGTG